MSLTDPKFGWRRYAYEEFILGEMGGDAGAALMAQYHPEFFDGVDWVYYARKPEKFMEVHFKAHFVSRGTFFPKKVLTTNGAFNMNARTLIAPFDTITLISEFYNLRKCRKVFTPAFVRLMTRNYGYDIE